MSKKSYGRRRSAHQYEIYDVEEDKCLYRPSIHDQDSYSVGRCYHEDVEGRGRTLDFDAEYEEVDKHAWASKWDFFASCMAYTLGLGNFWKFPYLCYKYGGGAFFVPYLVVLCLCGIPLYFLELSVGQYSGLGPGTIWKVVPLFSGMGYAMLLLLIYVTIYYNVIVGWTVYYFFASMVPNTGWTTCNNTWNTPDCTTIFQSDSLNGSDTITSSLVIASQEYFQYNFLGMSKGIGDIGGLSYKTALPVLLVWIILCASVSRGVRSSAKVAIVTCTAPIILILIFLVWGLSMDGFMEGIRHYVTPQWHMLARTEVWYEAAVHVFFSLGIGYGALIMLSSHNRFHSSCKTTAFYVCLIDAACSCISGFVVFSILGVLSKQLGKNVELFLKSDFELAFVVMPNFSDTTYGRLLIGFFYLTLILLGIGSQQILYFAIVDSFDEILHARRGKNLTGKQWLLLDVGFGALCYLLGLVLTAQGGVYVLRLFEKYALSWTVLLIGFLEFIVIAWIYGFGAYSEKMKTMLGYALSWWWRATWCVITPLFLLFLLVFIWVPYEGKMEHSSEFPWWAHMIGFVLMLLPILCLPVAAIHFVMNENGPWKMRLRRMIQINLEWDPEIEHVCDEILYGNTEVPRTRKRKRRVSLFSDDMAIRYNPDSSSQSKIRIRSLGPGVSIDPDMSPEVKLFRNNPLRRSFSADMQPDDPSQRPASPTNSAREFSRQHSLPKHVAFRRTSSDAQITGGTDVNPVNNG